MQQDAQKSLDILNSIQGPDHEDAYEIALIYIGMGNKTEALVWLKRAWEERKADNLGIVYAKVDPALDPVRSESLFQALLKAMGLGSPTGKPPN